MKKNINEIKIKRIFFISLIFSILFTSVGFVSGSWESRPPCPSDCTAEDGYGLDECDYDNCSDPHGESGGWMLHSMPCHFMEMCCPAGENECEDEGSSDTAFPTQCYDPDLRKCCNGGTENSHISCRPGEGCCDVDGDEDEIKESCDNVDLDGACNDLGRLGDSCCPSPDRVMAKSKIDSENDECITDKGDCYTKQKCEECNDMEELRNGRPISYQCKDRYGGLVSVGSDEYINPWACCYSGKCYKPDETLDGEIDNMCCGSYCKSGVKQTKYVDELYNKYGECCDIDGKAATGDEGFCTGETPYCETKTKIVNEECIPVDSGESVCGECRGDNDCIGGSGSDDDKYFKCCSEEGANKCYDRRKESCCYANVTNGGECAILDGDACVGINGVCYYEGKNTKCKTKNLLEWHNEVMKDRYDWKDLGCGGGEYDDKCLVGVFREDINKQIDGLCGSGFPTADCSMTSYMKNGLGGVTNVFHGDPYSRIYKGDAMVSFKGGEDSYFSIGGGYHVEIEEEFETHIKGYKTKEVNQGGKGRGRGRGGAHPHERTPKPVKVPITMEQRVTNTDLEDHVTFGYSDLFDENLRYYINVRSDLDDLWGYNAGLLLGTGNGKVNLELEKPIGREGSIFWIRYILNF